MNVQLDYQHITEGAKRYEKCQFSKRWYLFALPQQWMKIPRCPQHWGHVFALLRFVAIFIGLSGHSLSSVSTSL